MNELRRAVFLDRDGVIVPELDNYLETGIPDVWPSSARAIARLNEAGFLVVVVTNQPAVAHGRLTEADVQAHNQKIAEQLAEYSAHVDRYMYCPHHPNGEVPEYSGPCQCRKPLPGMLFDAAAELGIGMAHSVIVGDRMTDVEAGHRAGCAFTILVESGLHEKARIVTSAPALDIEPDAQVADLEAAVAWLLEREAHLPHGQ